jgi:hypothetical protein
MGIEKGRGVRSESPSGKEGAGWCDERNDVDRRFLHGFTAWSWNFVATVSLSV